MAALPPGTRLGPYEIVAPLGAGGMGEVYRAKDTRLGREVAIKVLPEHLSAQPEIRARFEREAKTVSSLNHPHICTLFDVGREGDTDYLVMELIEGETLASRLQRGPLAAADLLRFGVQIADALDRAHRAGVVHRDLKPANVMIARGGAKLMDFGLSRVTGLVGSASGAHGSLTRSPTMAQALTAEGTLLGTFQYMSPEQLEGRDTDVRSDVWALGCVLYEMATGRRAFEGRSQASLIAAILERQPAPIGEAPSGSTAVGGPPAGLDRLIRNCLAKDPEERIQTAHDVRLQLQGLAENAGLSATSVAPSAISAAAPPSARAGSARLPWAVAGLALLVAAGLAAWTMLRPGPARLPVRFQIDAIPGTTDLYWPRVSPDGRFILLEAPDSAGTVQAWVRPIDQVDAVPVPGTKGLRRAYWSPDGREIVFVANDQLQRAPVGGGSPIVIGPAQGGVDLSWGSKGMILMDGLFNDSLRVVSATGGDIRPATRIDRAAGEIGSAWPSFLPDGEHFLFIGNPVNAAASSDMRLGRLGSLDSKLLGKSDGRVEYAPGGWVVFLRGGNLVAQKLDVAAAKLTGEPVTIADGVRVGSVYGNFSISPSGVLAFARQRGTEALTLREVSRSGVVTGAPLVSGPLSSPEVSPDGTRLLFLRRTGFTAGGDVSVLDLARGTDTRLTSSGSVVSPRWSPDGRRFAFLERSSTASRVRVASADGSGKVDSIDAAGSAGGWVDQWSPDGSGLVYTSGDYHLFEVPLAGGPPHPIGDPVAVAALCRLSPDGRWAAYSQGTLPNVNVFVEGVAGGTGRWQISTTPGARPRWVREGRGLVFEGFDGRLMEVDVDTKDGFHPGTPRPLFKLPLPSIGIEQNSWTCDANGEHFYVLSPTVARISGIVEVVTDFPTLVKRR